MDDKLTDQIYRQQAQARVALSVSGRKVVGTLCLAAPVELIEAAGAVPVRLMPSGDEAELRGGRFLASDSCSFCKAVLGNLDLAAVHPEVVLGATTCDQMRRNLEIVSRDLKIRVLIFNAPRGSDDSEHHALFQAFGDRIFDNLIQEISAWAKVKIEENTLKAAINRRQAVRKRLRALLHNREQDFPTLNGAEFHALMTYFQTAPLDDFEPALPEIEQFIADRQPTYRLKPLRMALLGSCVGEDDRQIIDLVEETGRAVIVYDALCTGNRALREEADLSENPYKALVQLYHDQVYCPHKRPNDRLFENIAADLRRLKVEGIIYKTLKFCHPWGFEARRFKETLGLPFLHLDHDYSPSGSGQLRTRIHAFLEQLTFSR